MRENYWHEIKAMRKVQADIFPWLSEGVYCNAKEEESIYFYLVFLQSWSTATDTKTQRHIDTKTQRHKDIKTIKWSHEDIKTQRHKDIKTQRHKTQRYIEWMCYKNHFTVFC